MTRMNNDLTANKEEFFDFHREVCKDLKSKFSRIHFSGRENIISFPHVYQRLGTVWHLKKEQSFKVLKDMENRGLIKIKPFHGIRLNHL